MATQYTSILKLALPVQGELSGTWGDVVNNNITSMVEEAVAGRSVINSWSGNSHTLTTADGTTAEARAAILEFTDTSTDLSGAATVICPAASKVYVCKNGSGQQVTVKTASGTGIAIPNGKSSIVFCDGTNVNEAVTNLTALDVSGAVTATGVITGLTVEATGDTAAGDNAAMGYTSAEGLILTGQGSTNDVTIKNDADADVLEIPTGTTNVTVTGDIIAAGTLQATGDTAAGDDAAIGYTSAEGLILTGQGSTNDVTIKNDADADVLEIPTGTTNVTVVGDIITAGTLQATGDTAAGDDAAIGYTSAEGIIITGQGSSTDVTIKNDADATVMSIATGTTQATFAGEVVAASLDISGNIDVDGTTNLDVVDIDGAVDMASTLTVAGVLTGASLDISGDIDIDGTTNLDAVDIDGAVQIDNTVTVGADDTGYDVKFFGATASAYMLWDEDVDDLILAGAARIVIPDGQLVLGSTAVSSTAAELNILDGVTSTTAELNILDGVTSTTAELNILDGVTATATELNYSDTDAAVGTVVASKVVTVDANKDASSFRNVTLTGALTAASLDISGDIDVDGTTNLDAVDIDGAVQIDNTVTVGADDTGYDVKFFGATASAYMLWDEDVDDLILAGAARIVIPDGQLVLGSTAVTATAAELNAIDLGGSVGTVVGGKVVTVDSSKDVASFRNITLTGELDAGSLDVSGDIDVDGTANLDVVDIDGAVDMASTLTVAGVLTGASLDISGDIDIDGTTNLDAVDIDGAVQIDNTVTVGADDTGYDVKFFGATSGAYMLWDESVDDLKLVGAAGLTVAGNIDVDGTTNLDAVDIDGAVQIDSTVTVGVDDTGYDVKFFGATSGAYMLWDESADDLKLVGAAGLTVAGDIDVDGTTNLDAVDIDGAVQIDNTVTVGVDDTGYDVKFFGATASAYMLWDESADDLILAGAARVVVPASGLVIGSTAVTSTAAELNVLDPALKENNSIWIGSDPSGSTNSAEYNVALGVNALLVITTGDQNTSLGFESGKALTTAQQNTLVGAYSGYSLTTGAHNTYIGRASGGQGDISADAGNANTGDYNVTVGHGSSAALKGASYNTVVGTSALASATIGNSNVAVGYKTLHENINGDRNTALGYEALRDLEPGSSVDMYNVAVGFKAGAHADTADAAFTGIHNTLLGSFAGAELTSGDSNVAVGYLAGGASSGSAATGDGNVAVGDNALNVVVGGHSNVAVGKNAMIAATSAQNNVAIGYQTLDAATTSFYNVAVGGQALGANDTGNYNTAVGYGSLMDQSGDANYNTAVGYFAGEEVTTGDNNTYIGAFAGEEATTAEYNAVVGYNAGGGATSGSATTGNYNAVLGYSALEKPTTAGSNTAVGALSMQSNLTANNSVCVGYNAGQAITQGDANTLVGYSTGVTATNLETGAYNTLVGAYCDTTATDSQKAMGFGYNLDCAAGYTTLGEGSNDIRAAHGTATWATVSDERYKKDIVDSSAGLNFINALRPRTFKYKTLGELPETFRAYEAGSTEVFKNSKTNHGFIAQEVKAAIDADDSIKDGFKLWDNRDDGSQEVAESALIPILVKAIQEQQALIESLTSRIAALES